VGLAAANLLVFLAWTLPRGYRLRSATARADAARAEAAQRREIVRGLRDRSSALVANRADLDRFYGKLVGPATSELLPALQEVERMARLPGLRPGSRSFQESDVTGTRVDRITVTLPLSGTYSQLVGFLREVEKSPRFLTVDRVSMRHEEAGTELQVMLSMYVRTAEEAEEGRPRGGR
jgi:Tfp pilus assembly protein PilO